MSGSDRLGDWRKEPEFLELVENIRRRGQNQAIRVRSTNTNWRPFPDNSLVSNDDFVIQSGRRRLAACDILGIKVKAVIATEEGDRALADLEERFHENTMRKNLSGFEELMSIGLIADALGDFSQEEIAKRLSVSQADVSLGRACVEMHDQIVASVDIANTPKRAFREIIPKLRKGDLAKTKPQKKKLVFKAEKGDVDVSVTPTAKGFSLTVKTEKEIDEAFLAEAIARIFESR